MQASLATLFLDTLRDPRRGLRTVLSMQVPLAARSAGLMLIAVASAILLYLTRNLIPIVDPVTAYLSANPLQSAIVQWVALILSVIVLHIAGRAFGGKGNLEDALMTVVWLQAILLVVQAAQIVVMLALPFLGGVVGIGIIVMFFWLTTQFITELHGFTSAPKVFAGFLAVLLVVSVVIAALIIAVGGSGVIAHV
jgi:hypothetical protein